MKFINGFISNNPNSQTTEELVTSKQLRNISTSDYVMTNLDEFYAYLGDSNVTTASTIGLQNDGFTVYTEDSAVCVYLRPGKYFVKNNYDINNEPVPYNLYNKLILDKSVEFRTDKDVTIRHMNAYAGFYGKDETYIEASSISGSTIVLDESQLYYTNGSRIGIDIDYDLWWRQNMAFYDVNDYRNNYIDKVTDIALNGSKVTLTFDHNIKNESSLTTVLKPDFCDNVYLEYHAEPYSSMVGVAVNLDNVVNSTIIIYTD